MPYTNHDIKSVEILNQVVEWNSIEDNVRRDKKKKNVGLELECGRVAMNASFGVDKMMHFLYALRKHIINKTDKTIIINYKALA